MIARVVNFASRENQIIDWYEVMPKVASFSDEEICNIMDFGKSKLENILRQLDLLIKEYPDALNESTILRKARILMEYAKVHNASLNNCYSYFNEEKEEKEIKSVYGIRILPNKWNSINKCITISQYNSTEDMFLSKSELRLRLNGKGLNYINMTYMNSLITYIFSGEDLLYMNPELFGKQKILK